MLKVSEILNVKEEIQHELLKLPGVHAVGLGRKETGGLQNGPVAIRIVVEKKLKTGQLDSTQMIPRDIKGFPTDILECPRLGSLSETPLATGDTRLYYPLRGGIRICPDPRVDPKPGFGTLGLIVQGPNGTPCILTAQHVIGIGSVFQPDTGTSAVAQYVRGNIGLDCSISELYPDINWYNWVLEIGAVQGQFNVTEHNTPYPVRKRGYSTGYSDCRITMVYVTGNAANGSSYEDNLWVSGPSGTLEPGDSGAVLVDDCNRVVGLLRERTSSTAALASPIGRVLSVLESHLYEDHMPRFFALHEGMGPNRLEGDRWIWGTYTDSTMREFRGDALWPPGMDTYGTLNTPYLVPYKILSMDPNTVQERLYCLHKDRNLENNTLWRGCFDGQNWLEDSDSWGFVETRCPPTAAVYKGDLYVFWVKEDKIYVGKEWLGVFITDGYQTKYNGLFPQNAPNTYGTSNSPAVAVYNGKLYVVHQEQDLKGALKVTTYDGSSWSGDDYIVTASGNRISTSERPGLATFKGDLYLVHDQAGDAGFLYYSVFNGQTWTDDKVLNSTYAPGSSGAVNLIVHNGELVCMREGRGNDQQIHCARTSDGFNWLDGILEPSGGGYFGCHSAPGLAHFPLNYNRPTSSE